MDDRGEVECLAQLRVDQALLLLLIHRLAVGHLLPTVGIVVHVGAVVQHALNPTTSQCPDVTAELSKVDRSCRSVLEYGRKQMQCNARGMWGCVEQVNQVETVRMPLQLRGVGQLHRLHSATAQQLK